MARTRGKMLVIRGGAIGDFILTLPAIAALRRTFPETHLEVLGYPKLAELAMAGGMIDGYRSIESRPLAGFFARGAKLDEELAEYFGSFAVIYSYLYDPDEIFKTNVGRTSKAQYIQGPHRPDEGQNQHASSIFLTPLEKMAIFDADPVPRLDLGGAAGALAPAAPWLAVHPGSGSERKNWPEKQWAELLRRIATETRWNILMAGGEAEGERLARLSREFPAERLRVARNLPLVQLAAHLRQASFFVGHDSGISHLAAALGIPLLLLWGPSNAKIWRPLHEGTRILLAGEGLGELPAEVVWEELLKIGSGAAPETKG